MKTATKDGYRKVGKNQTATNKTHGEETEKGST
jgi:hypothetical protein